jgi:DNA-binding transcriptional regulator GbsR (MarR family)
MLILNTPDGDFAIAKGNIHTIQEDYDVGYYYVTKDIASYPFRSINGIRVKDIDHAYELVKTYADENGEQPIELELDEETERWSKQLTDRLNAKAEEARKKLKPITDEEYAEALRLMKTTGLVITGDSE